MADLAPARPPASRRRRVPIKTIVWTLVAIFATWTVVSLVLLGLTARSARAELTQAVTAARAGDLATTDTQLAAAGTNLHRASLAAGQLPLRVLGYVPVLGPHLDAARVTARAGDLLVNATARPLLVHLEKVRTDGLKPTEVATLIEPTQRAAAASAHANAELSSVQASSLRVGGSQFAEIQRQVAQANDGLQRVSSLVAAAPTLLGNSSPQRYLLVFQNQAEERATGGLWGSWAELSLDKGTPTLVGVGSNDDFLSQKLALDGVPKETVEVYGNDLSDITTINRSPNLPVAAQLFLQAWTTSGHQPVNGVIAVTPHTLAQLLDVVGPVTVPGGPQLTSANAESVLQGEVYTLFPEGTKTRNAYLDRVTLTIFAKVLEKGISSPGVLEVIANSARSGDVQLWSADPTTQKSLNGSALGGSLPSPSADLMGVYLNSTDGSKLGEYLFPSFTTSCADQRVQLTLQYRPPAVVDRYARGWRDSLDHEVSVAVYLPPRRDLLAVTVGDTEATVTTGHEAGWRVARFPVNLKPGTTTEVSLALSGADSGMPEVITQPLRHRSTLPAAVSCS